MVDLLGIIGDGLIGIKDDIKLMTDAHDSPGLSDVNTVAYCSLVNEKDRKINALDALIPGWKEGSLERSIVVFGVRLLCADAMWGI
ncbi:MAG: hypothetical protein ACK6BG_08535 [Cyanobacteriota bacterium]